MRGKCILKTALEYDSPCPLFPEFKKNKGRGKAMHSVDITFSGTSVENGSQESENISCTKFFCFEEHVVRASILHVLVLLLVGFYMDMNGWVHRKLKLRLIFSWRKKII